MVDRLSTSLAQQNGIYNILQQQKTLNETQQQISSGKRILSPSDDPAGSIQLMDLSESLSRLEQFQDNLNYAQNRLSLSESTLSSVTDNLQRVRELAVQGFNSTNSATDKKSLALEILQRLDELVALANTKDANGDYLYAGFKSQTEPFSGSAATGSFSYNGDQGVRYLKVGENRTITDGNAGAEVFFDLQDKDGNAESMFATLYGLATDLDNAVPAAEEALLTLGTVPENGETLTINSVVYEFNTGAATSPNVLVDTSGSPTTDTVVERLRTAMGGDSTVTAVRTANQLLLTSTTEGSGMLTLTDGTSGGAAADITVTSSVSIPLFDHLDQLDTALGRILDVRAQLGARLNVLDSQNNVNQDFKLSIQTTKSEIEDLDMAEAISRFNLQIVSLQAAQQAFVKVQNLSLFNLL